MSDPLVNRAIELDIALADCNAQLAALDAEFAARRQPILDAQAAAQAERDALVAASPAVSLAGTRGIV